MLARRLPTAVAAHVTTNVLAAMSPSHTPSGVVALAGRPRADWAAALRPAPALLVIAVDVQDAGNLGAIVRAADAGGATGVVAAGSSADPFGWKALRGAMGSAFRLPVLREREVAAAIDHARQAGLAIVASAAHGGSSPHAVDLAGPTAIVLGSEGLGLDPEVVANADARVTIPMRAGVDSLNVAVAAALMVYEARSQRARRGA